MLQLFKTKTNEILKAVKKINILKGLKVSTKANEKGKSSIIKKSISFKIAKSDKEPKAYKESKLNKLPKLNKENNVKNVTKKSLLSKILNIRVTLFIGLIVPVLLLAIYGVVSYTKSQDAIITNYENSSASTLNAISDYLGFGLNIIDEKTEEFISNSDIRVYYNRKSSESDPMSAINQQYTIQANVVLAKETNSFVAGIHIFGENGKGITTATVPSETLYTTFMESPEAKLFENKETKYVWVGSHTGLDSQLVNEGVPYTTADYAMSIIKKMPTNKGYVAIDISKQQILDMFAKYDLGEGSIVGLVNGDGREVILGSEEESLFSGLSDYSTVISSVDLDGKLIKEYNGKDYLFLYSKNVEANVTVCALIPKSTILKQVDGLKLLNIVFVSVAFVFSILMVIFIAGGVSKAIISLMKSIDHASKGDLTTKFDTKRHDEFMVLSNGINNMITSMRKLIGEVQEVGTKVSTSANGLSNTSEDLLTATEGISQTIDDIQNGVVQQVGDTEQCLLQMSSLSDQINKVYSNTNDIEKIAGNTKIIAGEGIIIIDELNKKSKATADVTQSVISKIEEFEMQSKNIKGFITVLIDIANQTNLLSLNASIEAARAGEAGRGFAVVAGEIRKLADQSVKAVNQIENIVSEIHKKTKDTVDTAKQAENIVESQTEALDRTVKVFNNISTHVNELVSNLTDISIGIKNIESSKEETLDAIQNISAVSEETAAASEEVSATALNQIDTVKRLRIAALELANNANILEESIKTFKIN